MAPGRWGAEAERRGCYCGIWDKDPGHFAKEGLPEGYCGTCIRCGAPGHTRHYPGPVPFTGAWCDRCYTVLKWTWPFRTLQGWVMLATLAGVVAAVAKLFSR